MISDAGDVVLAAFPYVDVAVMKRRPAVVLSSRSRNEERGETLLMMVTTGGATQWSDDTIVQDLTQAGLHRPCVVRTRFYSLINDMVGDAVGALSARDRQRVAAAIAASIQL